VSENKYLKCVDFCLKGTEY